MIEVGSAFPRFALPNQDSRVVRLDDFQGRWLVVYVYPKDDTPGCTIQGKSFTASRDDFERAGATVVGLSAADVASHKHFCDKFAFTIDLLADPEARLLGALGVEQSDYKGTLYWKRTSFLVDPDGVLRKVYLDVKPDGHDRALLEDLRALKSGGPQA